MNIMSLDLEMNQPSKSIIQIGIAIGHLESGLILESSSYIINAKEELNPFIVNLTGITQNQVNNGITLDEAYKHIVELHKEYQCFRNCLTWGGGDSDTLRQQLGLDTEKFIFGRRWIDAKTVYISRCFARGEKSQAGLSKAMTRSGLEFIGKAHDAEYDAINTFLLYFNLLKDLKEGLNREIK